MNINIKTILHSIVGIAITIFVFFVAAIIHLILFVDFNDQESLRHQEVAIITSMIFVTIVFAISLTSGLKYWRNNDKCLSIFINIIPFIFLCLFTFFTITALNYYTPFDASEWNKSEEKNENMAITLFKNEELIGMSKKEVIDKLGKPNGEYNSEDILSYSTKFRWHLLIFMNEGVVTDVDYGSYNPYTFEGF